MTADFPFDIVVTKYRHWAEFLCKQYPGTEVVYNDAGFPTSILIVSTGQSVPVYTTVTGETIRDKRVFGVVQYSAAVWAKSIVVLEHPVYGDKWPANVRELILCGAKLSKPMTVRFEEEQGVR